MRLTRARRGVALVELLAALVITACVGGAVVRLLDRSQRFVRGAALITDQRAQLAVAAYALEGALLHVAPHDGDLLGGSDSSITYAGLVGGGVACAVGTTSVDLAAATLASGIGITWWNSTPQAGDTLLVFDEGASADAADDRWLHLPLTGVASRLNACLASPFVDSLADAGKSGWRLSTSASLPGTVAPGAPVRVTRPARFALYRSGTEWMLGWAEWNSASGAWNTIQPVAGPLLAYSSSGATSGLTLFWRDSTGTIRSPISPQPVRLADVALGAVTRQQVRHDGVARGIRRDSLAVRLPLRNAP